ncbi:MAG: glutamine--tRNA ligase/YqeY domain fusion protein [Caldilineae bacterium]|nr:MAG: glutamine--tRNA ligase/YqeY domain fusion protein [Caldilineae bacterium]
MQAHSPTTEPRADRASAKPRDFIREIIERDIAEGTYGGQVVTRFPPEPNGYLHIGHAKSICLNFGVAEEYNGRCHLRFDDTNPTTEDIEYVESIKEAIRWLGFDWGEHLYFASDYFEQLYQFAEQLIKDGKAYVDSLSEEEIRAYRGTVTEPGRESPYRNRSVEENLDLFRRMRAGEFPDGAHVLRAKIDMSSPNMLLRDPILYRIRHAHHYRTGDRWCIYPMYDFAHPLSDAIEHITHSLCTLEFENNRAIYDWLTENLIDPPRPRQYEFARLNLDYTVMSKRKLLRLVEEGHVSGWDDPRLPTLAGLRRRGVTPEAIRTFCDIIGVAKVNSRVEYELLEHTIRDDLNYRSPRVMCVLRPLKVIITNYPEDRVEWLDAPYWPRDIPKEGSRKVPFARELFIEQDDFMEDPPPGYHRLAPGREVRLRHSYVIRCDEVIKDEAGEVVALHCTYDPETLGARPRGRKVKGTIHWVSAAHALPAEVRLYERLFIKANPDEVEEGKTFLDYLNPDSLQILRDARVEPSVADDPPDTRYQFERQGYFIQDCVDSRPEALVFNRIVALRDSWSKQAAATEAGRGRPEPEPGSREGTASEARARARAASPELAAAYDRYLAMGLSELDADIISGDPERVAFFDEAVRDLEDSKLLANWLNNVLLGEIQDASLLSLPFSPSSFGRLVALVAGGTISSVSAKQVLAEMLQKGGDPEAIVEERGLRLIGDEEALATTIADVLARHPDKVAAYRAGKTGLIGFFVGQVMRATQGKADPRLVRTLLEKRLAS